MTAACDGDQAVLTCSRDADCKAAESCGYPRDAAGEDGAPLPLGCAAPRPAGAAAGATCMQAADCASGICLLVGRCAVPCVEPADCASDPDDAVALAPDCAVALAKTGRAALQPVQACVARVSLPAGAEALQHAFPAALPGGNEAVEVEVPRLDQAATSWVIEQQGAEDLLLTRLAVREGPSTHTVFALGEVTADGPAQDNPVSGFGYPVTVAMPNGPRGIRGEATVILTLRSAVAGDLRITQLGRDAAGDTLRLNLFYVGAPWSVEGDDLPGFVGSALDAASARLAAAGIQLEVHAQIPVRGETGRRLAVLEAPGPGRPEIPALHTLFELSRGLREPAVNLFFVERIEGRSGRRLALSGGIPGPLGMHGTAASGIAFGTEPDLLEDTEAFGARIAHEIAHHLGLFHTSEADGRVLDPLPDTPECRGEADANDDGRLSPEECEGRGGDNLMFWSRPGSTLTAQQGDVLRQALVLQ